MSLMKFNFPIIGLSEYKFGSNSLINNISSPGYIFCYDETKSTHSGIGFFINEKTSFIKRENLKSYQLKISNQLLKNLIFLNRKTFIYACTYKHQDIPLTDFSTKYLTPLWEKLNREEKTCFWWEISITI